MDICLQRILDLMAEKGIKNLDLTEYLDISKTAVSDWKSGKRSSYFKYIVEISEFLDVSADYLLGRTPYRKGTIWDELIGQYQLCDPDKKEIVDKLLGVEYSAEDNKVHKVNLANEKDMALTVELLSIFEQLNLVGKSRVLATAADELDKRKTT